MSADPSAAGAGSADAGLPPDDTPSFGTGAGGTQAGGTQAGGTETESPAAGEGPDRAADRPDDAPASEGADAPAGPISVEDLVVDLERVSIERDEYLDSLRRLQAEFENYRKAVAHREADARARANSGLVSELLPVLDACDGAINSGAEDVGPIRAAFIDALTKQGLERLEPLDAEFDPELHEAVIHEEGDGEGGPVVSEVLRVGYSWKGNVVRPAMVKVRG